MLPSVKNAFRSVCVQMNSERNIFETHKEQQIMKPTRSPAHEQRALSIGELLNKTNSFK